MCDLKTKLDIAAIIISILAFIAAFCSAKFSKDANNLSKEANKLSKEANNKANLYSQGNLEINVRDMISTARFRQLQIFTEISKNANNDVLDKAYISTTEDLLNAYDTACALCIDKKIDEKRFKKTYEDEIRQVYASEEAKPFFDKRPQKFQSIEKICQKWFKRE